MSNPVSLKSTNRKAVWLLVAVDVLLLALCLKGDGLSWEVSHLLQKSTITVLLTTTTGPFLAGILNEFFSPNLKTMLVFWRIKYPLIGHRAFSEIAQSDPRTDINNLKKTIGEFPISPIEQNQLWYKLYKKHEKDTTVMGAHQSFLLYRDFASLTCLIGLLLIGASFALEVPSAQFWIAFAIIALQYGLCVIAAQNTGKRLVQNVLSLESLA